MKITWELVDDMVAHALAEAPRECCGIVTARAGEAVAVHPATNRAESAARYEMDDDEQFQIMIAMEEAGLELGAIYHSHPRSAPVPSGTDVALAFYPAALYVIVGHVDTAPEVRAWRIADGEVAPAVLEIQQ